MDPGTHKFIKSNEVAIIGFFAKENDLYHKVLLESVWKLHQEIDRDDIGAGFAAVATQSVLKKLGASRPSVVVYLDGKMVEEDGSFTGEKWSVKELMNFLRMFLPLSDQDMHEEDPYTTGGSSAGFKTKQHTEL